MFAMRQPKDWRRRERPGMGNRTALDAASTARDMQRETFWSSFMSELPTEHFEHVEHAMHASHEAAGGNKFISTVAMTIAVLAVVAATVGSLETLESSGAISAKNEAVLLQNKATDNWNFYQAKSLKKNMYDIAAASAADGPVKEDFKGKAKRYDEEGADIQKEAKKLEEESVSKNVEGDKHEHRHHVLTAAVTLLHVGIALATISIVTGGKRWPWAVSLALALGGLVATAWAYLPMAAGAGH